jgi:hypothetical protein
MPQNQWSQPSQGWRPKNFQHPALLSPPLQNNTTPNSFPPKKPHLPTQPTPNPSNQQTQPIYNNDTTYQTYSMELQEINIRSGNILQQQPKFIEIEEYDNDPGGYRWPPTFSNSLKTIFWQFWQFTIFSSF